MTTSPRDRSLQDRAFVAALGRTGNVREAARLTGVARAVLYRRRKGDPAFAARWAAALVAGRVAAEEPAGGADAAYRPVRLADGRVQLRRSRPGRLGAETRHASLTALAATANVRLSARAAGFSHSAFYAHARADPAFAREMRAALAAGFARIEAALLDAGLGDAAVAAGWRRNAPAPIPPMTVDQALQLLSLHQKEVRLGGIHPSLRRRPGEPEELMRLRLMLMAEHRLQRERDAFTIAEAAREDARRAAASRAPHDPPAALPDLAQVTGWSRATPEPPARGEEAHATPNGKRRTRRPGRAMFGGWRIG